MTGKFTLKDPVRCAHYARFFQHLTLTEANILYWFLSNNLTAEFSKAGSSTPRQTRRLRRRRLHYLSIASLCFILALICVVLEVFAAFNIEYCDGEDLIQLYWGFWSILQVGSLIAILGVMLQFWIVLGNVQTPSWAVALGTPVLVFAALGYIFRHIGKSWICRKSSIESEDDTDVEKGSSEENEDAEENAKDEEKTGSWAARWITWAPEDQLMRERNEDSLDRVRTMRSGDCSDMEFASRATTIYTPGQPGDVRRTSTY
ncbi:hypothetical protein SS1G_11290 [Sclerotinia sclerotiorum 1980 UF-70]|uniref:Uncharacterized protein n=1 Tax=Sclerotinia sclerotiorum (strain ATCC 18683 / 1980 / Ss-1) TaxID=665079 RepID=A7F121_SCLS1|nr:hypothetical protein SS1G_11290 [Sclerotinia sclerotiorum 1980 UF-70]EDN95413.1 hypothetical protein SS1G_11290 [Sclerotinia sclerotiorum 1980 UF-70]